MYSSGQVITIGIALVVYAFVGLAVLRFVVEFSDQLLGEKDAASLAREAKHLGTVFLLMLLWPIGVAFLLGRLLLVAGRNIVAGGRQDDIPQPHDQVANTPNIEVTSEAGAPTPPEVTPPFEPAEPAVLHVLPRTGHIDLSFDGWLLADEPCSTPSAFLKLKIFGARDVSSRVQVFATVGGAFVVAVHSTMNGSLNRLPVRADALKVALPDQVLSWLKRQEIDRFHGGYKAAWEAASSKHPGLAAIRRTHVK